MRKPHPRSPRGVAERNGLCINTIYNEISRGNLKSSKIGTRRIITEEHEREWLEQGARRA